MTNLSRLPLKRRTGSEPFHAGGQSLGFDLLDFWGWSGSDLIDNTARGVLAEYLVAKALGISTKGVREGWLPWDLQTEDKLRIEVKSAAFLQSWHQDKLSKITFVVPPKRGWNPDTNKMEPIPKRHAQVYVFALFAHTNKDSVDPLDLTQWQFFVLPTSTLNARRRSQHSITLKSLEALAGGPHNFQSLSEAVKRAAGK